MLVTTVILAALSAPRAATAAEEEIGAPGAHDLVEALRGINQQMRRVQRLLGDELGFDTHTAMMELGQAQVDFFAEDHPQAALRLLQLVSRPGFRDELAYPEALYFLGESLWAMGLHKAAIEHLRESLQPVHQAPGEFRRRLARYLVRAGEVARLDEVRGHWRRYQGSRADGPLGDEDREVRYEYAKALFRGGALAEAEALFSAIDEADPYFLRARYFMGVLQLRRDDPKAAEVAFKLALEGYDHLAGPPLPRDDEEASLRGPDRELDINELFELPAESVESDTLQRRMGALIHLALARLAAAREDDVVAWFHYRAVPPGDANFASALSEATYVLFRRGHFVWCARLIDQALAGRGDDVSAAQLGLWQAQLLAKGARYEDARARYEVLGEALLRRASDLEAELSQDRRLFPQAVLAWTAPDDANRARALEAEFVEQEESLAETHEIAAALQGLLDDAEALPPVRFGRARQRELHDRMDAFDLDLRRAADAARTGGEVRAGGTPVTEEDVARLAQSGRRLRTRLERFDRTVDTFDRTWRARIRAVLAAEVPNLRQLTGDLGHERASIERLGAAMRTTARTNLENFAAEAQFGQVDIAYWRKEEITRQISETLEGQRLEQLPLDEIQRSLPKPRPKAAPAPAPRDEDQEGEPDGAEGGADEATPDEAQGATPPVSVR